MNHTAIAGLETWLSQQIIGQADLVKKLLIAILADGHLLVEGAHLIRDSLQSHLHG